METTHHRTEKIYKRIGFTTNIPAERTIGSKFLFIQNGQLPEIHNISDNSFKVKEGFTRARFFLSALLDNEQRLPDAIFINLHQINNEFKSFCNWLQTRNELQSIPVICNKGSLSENETELLLKNKLADDVIDFEISNQNLQQKALFLKKAKQYLKKESLEPNLFFKNILKNPDYNFGSIAKRALDIFVSFTIILLLLPLYFIIALAIKLDSKGSVFYSSLRAGKGFNIFKFYKFRTMVVDADKKINDLASFNLYSDNNIPPKFFKLKNDPRVTRLGAFLRNSSLDELPQLFNVLKGNMSLVGNRPLPLYEAASLTTNECAERFMAPAGITGLWQIKKRGDSKMTDVERIQLDISYARKNSFTYDLWILFKTPSALFQKVNV